jgi:hypothetical protein
VNPECHYKAFFKIAQLFDSEELRQFSCFPLQTSFIPCYMALDSKVIHQNILKLKTAAPTKENKFQTWGVVVNLKNKVFKDQGTDKSLRFQGTIETDGVGVSILKQNTDTGRKIASRNTEPDESDNAMTYTENSSKAELVKTENKCVLMNPGRRNLLYCMKETSIVQENQVMVYTKMNRTKLDRHFKILRKKTKPAAVETSEAELSKTKSSSVDIEEYEEYVKKRALEEKALSSYYGNEIISINQSNFSLNQVFTFNIKNKADLYFGQLFITRIKVYFPQPNQP